MAQILLLFTVKFLGRETSQASGGFSRSKKPRTSREERVNIQGRRNRPFFGSKVPFSCVKNVFFLREKRLAFFCPKGTFENLNLCYFPEKYDISGKFFGISRKFFFIFRKKCDISEKNFLVCPEKIFETSLPSPIFP